MSIWWALLFMAAGAAISEMYHARMWERYQRGKNEGRKYREDTTQRYTIKR